MRFQEKQLKSFPVFIHFIPIDRNIGEINAFSHFVQLFLTFFEKNQYEKLGVFHILMVL